LNSWYDQKLEIIRVVRQSSPASTPSTLFVVAIKQVKGNRNSIHILFCSWYWSKDYTVGVQLIYIHIIHSIYLISENHQPVPTLNSHISQNILKSQNATHQSNHLPRELVLSHLRRSSISNIHRNIRLVVLEITNLTISSPPSSSVHNYKFDIQYFGQAIKASCSGIREKITITCSDSAYSVNTTLSGSRK